MRWVKPESIHLTLKFIGEAAEADLPLIKKAMDISASSSASFNLRYGNLGVFPSLRTARVIWADLAEGAPEVQNLAAKLEGSLTDHRLKPEKRSYNPHLTLGRLRFPMAENRLRAVIETEKSFKTSAVEADKILLFNSRLSRHGPLYTLMHQSLLNKTITGDR